jgi:Calcineurin-like phosphoesterase
MTRTTALLHLLLMALSLRTYNVDAKMDLSSFVTGSDALMQSSSESVKAVLDDFAAQYKNLSAYFEVIRPEDSPGDPSSDEEEDELPAPAPAILSLPPVVFTPPMTPIPMPMAPPTSSPVEVAPETPTPIEPVAATPEPTRRPRRSPSPSEADEPTPSPVEVDNETETAKPTKRRRRTPEPAEADPPTPPPVTAKPTAAAAPTQPPVTAKPSPSRSPEVPTVISPVRTRPPYTTPPTMAAPGSENSETFYIIGDVPYNEYQAQKIQWQLTTLESDAEFLVHVGDIRYAGDGSKCTLEYYQNVSNIFKLSPKPMFIIMGDNEWNDCPNPDDGWNYWHEVFGNFEDNWDHPDISVVHPSDRKEAFYFVHKGVLHIGLNMVGGQRLDRIEWDNRLNEQQLWVKALIQTYLMPTILFGHADPKNYHAAFFNPLVEFIQDTLLNSIPIFYFNGDGHT